MPKDYVNLNMMLIPFKTTILNFTYLSTYLNYGAQNTPKKLHNPKFRSSNNHPKNSTIEKMSKGLWIIVADNGI